MRLVNSIALKYEQFTSRPLRWGCTANVIKHDVWNRWVQDVVAILFSPTKCSRQIGHGWTSLDEVVVAEAAEVTEPITLKVDIIQMHLVYSFSFEEMKKIKISHCK